MLRADKLKKEITNEIVKVLGISSPPFVGDAEEIADAIIPLFNSNLKEERAEYKSTLLEKVRKMRKKDLPKQSVGLTITNNLRTLNQGFNNALDQIESIIGEI